MLAAGIRLPVCTICSAAVLWGSWLLVVGTAQPPPDGPYNRGVGKSDWPQLGGTPSRNNAPDDQKVPTEWDVKSGKNIKWSVPLGSQTYGNVVVANGQIYVGTNNGGGYLTRYPPQVDLGVLLCLRESDGTFLWQYSSEKLPTGRIHDWPMVGICSSPVVEGNRLWFVSNRGEVVCLDTDGFRDGENDGPFTSEKPANAAVFWEEQHEADVVWSFDMMKELGVRQHHAAICAPTTWGDVLFICTSNGVDESHRLIPAPDAPSFMAMDKHTGKVLWTDNSPGNNILHGQWSCPAVGVFDNVPQVVFAGGDGWLYSFRADRWEDGRPILLWKFDANPKDSIYRLAQCTRNPIIAVPVIHDGLVYVAVGEDPEHGEGPGHLWCVDPTKRGDVSAELVVDEDGHPLPHQRIQANASPLELFRFRTDEWDQLDKGNVPQSLQIRFKQVGLPLPPSFEVKSKVKGQQWILANGRERNILLSATFPTLLTASLDVQPVVIPNPKSAVIWHYNGHDRNGNGKLEFDETMHRTIGSPVVKNDLLYIVDESGLAHCLDAKNGKQHWTCDLLASS